MTDIKMRKFEISSANPVRKDVLNNVKLFLNGKVGEQADKGGVVFTKAAELIVNSAKGSTDYYKGILLLNEAFEVTIPSKVSDDLKGVLGVFAEVHTLGVNGAAKLNRWERDRMGNIIKGAKGTPARKQRMHMESVPVAPISFTGMGAMDYRDLANDPSGEYNKLQAAVTLDLQNEMVKEAEQSLYVGLEAAFTAGKVGAIYLEAATVVQASLNIAIAEVRTGGKGVSIFGDFRVASQINSFVGVDSRASDKALTEIDGLGYVTNYLGSDVMAIDNFYDYDSTYAVGGATVWAKQLSKANLYVVAKGVDKNPNHMFLYGGVTSMTGSDVETGEYVFRVDQIAGTYFVPERTSHVAIISDTNFQ